MRFSAAKKEKNGLRADLSEKRPSQVLRSHLTTQAARKLPAAADWRRTNDSAARDDRHSLQRRNLARIANGIASYLTFASRKNAYSCCASAKYMLRIWILLAAIAVALLFRKGLRLWHELQLSDTPLLRCLSSAPRQEGLPSRVVRARQAKKKISRIGARDPSPLFLDGIATLCAKNLTEADHCPRDGMGQGEARNSLAISSLNRVGLFCELIRPGGASTSATSCSFCNQQGGKYIKAKTRRPKIRFGGATRGSGSIWPRQRRGRSFVIHKAK